MKTTSFIARITVALLVAAVIVAFAPQAVQAGKVKIWAAEFKPQYGGYDYSQFSDIRPLSGAGLRFFAMVKVPKDTTITKVAAMYKGANTTALADIYLYRVRLDGSEREDVQFATTDGNDINAFVNVSTTNMTYPGYIVKGIDRYFVYIYLQNSATTIRWVKIFYE